MDLDVAVKVISIISGKNDEILSKLKRLKEKCKANDPQMTRDIDLLWYSPTNNSKMLQSFIFQRWFEERL